MSKITFRADDDLIDRLEALDASKSEVMRDALREYLDTTTGDELGAKLSDNAPEDRRSLTGVLEARIDELIHDRLDAKLSDFERQTVNVNLAIEHEPLTTKVMHETGETPEVHEKYSTADGFEDTGTRACSQCGDQLTADHVYCPNCGEKATRRIFCDCGDELRTDWAFCPSCGRRTPAADVLDNS